MGTYGGREGQRSYRGVASGGEYRGRVQHRAFKLADVTLRAGGRLLIVDRREVPTPETIADALSTHRRQASTLAPSLRVSDNVDRFYYPPTDGVATHETRGTSGRAPDFSRLALVAIYAEKWCLAMEKKSKHRGEERRPSPASRRKGRG